MILMRFALLFLVLFCLGVSIDKASAHDSRPLHISIKEQLDGIMQLKVNVPPSVGLDNIPIVMLDCPSLGPRFDCRAQDVFTLRIMYPDYNPALSSVITFMTHDGLQTIATLGPAENVWTSSARPTSFETARDYVYLGVQHILLGYDHLLFLLLLLFIARRSIIITITGFTLSHSLTLGLAALDYVRVSIPAVEVLIALSIIFLAAEIIRPKRNTLVWRYPFWVTTLFGLIHGFGFASVLKDIGLPQNDLVLGLAGFNIGVEIGQILFILIAILFFKIAMRLMTPSMRFWMTDSGGTFCATIVGVVASYWFWLRIVEII